MTDLRASRDAADRGATIVVLTGVGAHRDPWHGLAATSRAAAEVLAGVGTVRHVTSDEPWALAEADLAVVNASGDLAEPEPASAEIVDALIAAHEAGVPILALHSSALAFRDDRRWAELMGGRWVPGVTMHPQIGRAVVQLSGGGAFELYDERYTALERDPATELLAEHTEDGQTHPLVWLRAAADGRGAVAYDALGHGAEAYAAPGHRALLARLVGELLGSAPVAPAPAPDVAFTARAGSEPARLDALGYEIVVVSPPGAIVESAGAFRDGWAEDGDPRRLVAGYLALEEADTPSSLRVIGHGVPVATLRVTDDGVAVAVPGATIDGRVLRAPAAGLAFVALEGSWRDGADGWTTLSERRGRVAVVHGPAAAKVENRIRLLDDVRRLAATGEESGP